MLHWAWERYAIWREQLSAALSAIGPLRLTKGQIFRLLLRKTKHDIRLQLNDLVHSGWTTAELVTLLVLVAVAVLLLIRLVARLAHRDYGLQLPTLHMQKDWDYPRLLSEGAKRFPYSPYIITYSGYEHVVFPSSSFDEVKRLNASRASTIDWFNCTMWQGWKFMGIDNNARYHTVAIDLFRALPSRVWMRQDHAEAAFEAVLGIKSTRHEWTAVSLWETVHDIVARMNSTGLLGPDLGADPRWLKDTRRLHRAMIAGIAGSCLAPLILRPLVAFIVFLPAKLVDWHMASLLRPMVERELSEYEAKESERGNGFPYSVASAHVAKDGDDGAGIDQRSINEKFPLTGWLLNRYRSEDDRLGQLLRDHLVITFESTASSSKRLYFMLAELATRPSLAHELREEVLRNTDNCGCLPLSYLNELRKLDSFMLESARAEARGHLALFRRIRKPLKLSIGPELPPGTLICVDRYHFAKSQRQCGDVPEMDPLRFFRMREEIGHEDMHQFTMPGPNNTTWGNGTQACPGRVFASVTMKVILAHLLTHYEIQLLPGDQSQPRAISMASGMFAPDTKAKIMIRLRRSS